MTPVNIEELDFIDDCTEPVVEAQNCSDISYPDNTVRQLIGKLEELRKSPVFQIVLRIQKLAKLYEEQTRLVQRNLLLNKKLEERNSSNRIHMAQLEVLRADRRKRTENISTINLNIIDESNNISSETVSLQDKKQNIADLKQQAVTRSKEVLRDYLDFINGRNIITSLTTSTPQIKPRPISTKSSKNKKILEEASILADSHNISRFLNASSSIFRCPLRFPLHWSSLTTHQETTENQYIQILYSDPKSSEYLKCLIEQLNSIKLVKKNRTLVGFLDASAKTPIAPVIQLNRNANIKALSMRDALFSQNRKKPVNQPNIFTEEIPDFT